jgi:hypothetical protein
LGFASMVRMSTTTMTEAPISAHIGHINGSTSLAPSEISLSTGISSAQSTSNWHKSGLPGWISASTLGDFDRIGCGEHLNSSPRMMELNDDQLCCMPLLVRACRASQVTPTRQEDARERETCVRGSPSTPTRGVRVPVSRLPQGSRKARVRAAKEGFWFLRSVTDRSGSDNGGDGEAGWANACRRGIPRSRF